MVNPISLDSYPTLICTIRLDPSFDVDVEIDVTWNGPAYGVGEYVTTQPVINSGTEVPTYTSTATLNAAETFYDSGDYVCSVTLNSPPNSEFTWTSAPASSQRLSGECSSAECIMMTDNYFCGPIYSLHIYSIVPISPSPYYP